MVLMIFAFSNKAVYFAVKDFCIVVAKDQVTQHTEKWICEIITEKM
jgi:hypothetical protein